MPLKAIYKKHHFFQLQIKCAKNLLNQIFLTNVVPSKTTILSCSREHVNRQENTTHTCMMAIISENKLCTADSNRDLMNTFTGQIATEEQSNDMLKLRAIGKESLDSFIKHHILGQSSITNTTIQRKKLLTMTSAPKKKKRVFVKDTKRK